MLKRILAKICGETNSTWGKSLWVALLWVRVAPSSKLRLSLCEMSYARPLLHPFYDLRVPDGSTLGNQILSDIFSFWKILNCCT